MKATNANGNPDTKDQLVQVYLILLLSFRIPTSNNDRVESVRPFQPLTLHTKTLRQFLDVDCCVIANVSIYLVFIF